MSYQPYNPSYYRSHLYAHQFNLPDAAFVNRKMPTYTSEMPQGVSPFVPSHKKHFQNMGYNSVISQQQLISHQSPEETNSPAKDKGYERNLSIQDIEGATTNTLISKAIKNRIKAKQYYLRREKKKETITPRRALHLNNTQKSYRQEEAEKLIKNYKNEGNYHHKLKDIKTEESSESPKTYASAATNQIINRYRNDIQQTEKQIHELQRKLQYAKRQNDIEKVNQAKSVNSIEQQYVKQVPEVKMSFKTSDNSLKLPKIGVNHYGSVKKTQAVPQQQKISTKIDRKRSYTQPNEQSYKQYDEYYYPNKDQIVQKVEKDDQRSSQQKINQSRMRRQQIRKLNPTYLSYGSFSGGQNARMVYL